MRQTTGVFTLLLLAVGVAAARADIDMTGTWTFSNSAAFGSGTMYSIQQAGTLVTMCHSGWSGSLSGTINPQTGELTWNFPPNQPIGGYLCEFQWTGTVSQDGGSLVANERYGVLCIPPPFTCHGECLGVSDHPSSAVRTSTTAYSCGCGNGIVDPGEACDPGPAPNGCCALDCTVIGGPGAACTDDGNVCTDDVCDGAGTCTHPANTGSCGTTCHGGTCGGGNCQLGAPAPAATPCDADGSVCTTDACDGTGQCIATYVCDPCTTCHPVFGCMPLDVTSCDAMDSGKIDIRVGATPDRDAVRSQFVIPYYSQGFGDPTTTTSYTFCAITSPSPGVRNLLLSATAPPAGTCGTKPCWSATADLVRYRNKSGTPQGLRKIDGKRAGAFGRRFSVTGGGPDLPLPSVLPAGESVSAALVAHDGPVFDACWGGTFTTVQESTATRYRARR